MSRELRDRQFRDSSNLRARGNLHGRFGTNPIPWFTWIFDQMKLDQGDRVLEIGCGPGTLWSHNFQRIPEATYLLSDLSAGMVNETYQHLQTNGAFCFLVCDAQAIPLAEAVCDTVVANHVLFFVPDISRALSEIQRVLTTDGRFYATTNGARNMHELGELLAEFDPSLIRIWENRTADHLFDFETGEELLEPWFKEIRALRYPDRLVVTDPNALTAYVLSTGSMARAITGREDEFRRFVGYRVNGARPLNISKDTGMFSALRR